MKTPYQPKKKKLDAFGNKGEGKKSRKQLKQGSKKNISFSPAFVNFPLNMSYTPALGSKKVHTIFTMWGPKMSNNSYPLFTMLTKPRLVKCLA
jgi:hypothetical protein